MTDRERKSRSDVARQRAAFRDLIPGLSVVQATFHRYVIDANRDPSGQSLYPGASTTELVPTTNFDGSPIWKDGEEPTSGEIAARLRDWHAPYHAALAGEMERVRDRHGVAILFDCHSIRSVIPWLFEGTLPDFNTGTNNGTTCDPLIEAAIAGEAAASGRTHVLNGRFKGGWTTRHYGRPAEGFHAVRIEPDEAIDHEIDELAQVVAEIAVVQASPPHSAFATSCLRSQSSRSSKTCSRSRPRPFLRRSTGTTHCCVRAGSRWLHRKRRRRPPSGSRRDAWPAQTR